MKHVATLASAILATTAGTAFSADLAARPYTKAAPMLAATYDWSGFYAGVHVGYGWGSDGGSTFTDNPPGSFARAFRLGEIVRFVGANPNGVLGGIQAGYNWQVGRSWVVGLEGDFSGSGLKGRGLYVYSGPFAPATQATNQSVDWLATLRARAGFTVDRLLIYGSGGAAIGGVRTSFYVEAPSLLETIAGSASSTRVGWVAGAGAEYAFTSNWSVKAEWLRFDLGSIAASGPQLTAGVPQRFGLTSSAVFRGDIAWVGVNYKFGGTVLAKY